MAVRSAQKGTYLNFRQRPMSDIVYQNQYYAAVLMRSGDQYNMEEKHSEFETENK